MHPEAAFQPATGDSHSAHTVDYSPYINFHEEQPDYGWGNSVSASYMKTFTDPAYADHYLREHYGNSVNEHCVADPSSESYDSAYVSANGNISQYEPTEGHYVATGHDVYSSSVQYVDTVSYEHAAHVVEPVLEHAPYSSTTVPAQDYQQCGTDYFPPPVTQLPVPSLNLIPCPPAPAEYLEYPGDYVDYSAEQPHYHEQQKQRVGHVPNDHARLHIHVSSGPPAPTPHARTRKVTRSPLELACYFCRGRKIACGWPSGAECMDQNRCYECYRRGQNCRYPDKSRRGQRRTTLIRA